MAAGGIYAGTLRRQRQPWNHVNVNWNNPLARGLISFVFSSAVDNGMPPYDIVTKRWGTASALGNRGGQGGFINGSPVSATAYNGSTSISSILLDLSPYQQITVTQRMFIDANVSYVASEYTTNFNNFKGFIVNPNTTNLSCVISNQPITYYEFQSDLLAIKRWHTVSFAVDRVLANLQIPRVIVNGQNKARTGGTASLPPASTFTASDSIYIGARSGLAGPFSGALSYMMIHNRCLSAIECTFLQANPWQLLLPPPYSMFPAPPADFFAPWTTLGMEFP